MVVLRNRLRRADDKWVIYEVGDPGSEDAPYDDPVAHMEKVRFSSTFQYFNSNLRVDNIPVNHSLVAGVSGTGYAPPSSIGATTGAVANGQVVITDELLYAHGSGHVPQFMVLHDGAIVQSTVVQQPDSFRARIVSAYATATEIRLQDIGMSSRDDLPATTLNYDVIIFGNLGEVPGEPLWRARPDGVVMGHGRISSEQRPLRRVSGAEDFFYLPVDRTIDVRNGAIRSVSPFGSNDIGNYFGTFFSAEFIKVTL